MSDEDALATPLPATLTTLDLRHCQRIAFLSDVHLQANEPATFHAWAQHLHTLNADALFILGDLFDVWLGDDILQHPPAAFERDCLARLNSLSQTLPIYWLVGNRDFLFGATACEASGMTAISDPCLVQADNQPWLVSHGDALWAHCSTKLHYLVRQHPFRRAALRDALEQVQELPGAHGVFNMSAKDHLGLDQRF